MEFFHAAQADALSTTTDPFTDVPATHWAAGYIAYCAQRGIINGMGDGTFQPDSSVTGLQFAKMLLCALGYNANDEYLGDDWSIKVSKDALSLKLFNGNLGGATNTPATREECALYAFNATTKVFKVSYSALLGGYITAGTSGWDAAAANEGDRIADDFKLYKQPTDADAFGRFAGHHWCIEKNSNIITADYDENEWLKATYTSDVTGDDIYQLLGKTFIDDVKKNKSANAFEVYQNSESAGDVGAGDDTLAVELDSFKKGEKKLEGTGNGVQTYVYAWSDEDSSYIRIVMIDTYLAKVEDVTEATSKKDPKTTVDVLDDLVTVNTNGFNTDKFDEGDYVLITVSDQRIQSMVAATVKETEISRFNKKGDDISIVAGGTTYVPAKNVAGDGGDVKAADADNITKSVVDGEDHKLYVDEYGYLIAISDVKAANNYVYVAQLGIKADTTGKLSDKDVLMADIYYADGTNALVTVNTKEDTNKDDEPNAFYDNDDTENYLKTIDGDSEKGLYKLTTKDDKAILVAATDVDTTDGNETFVTKGVYAADGSDKYDGKTVFFYVHGEYDPAEGEDDLSVTVYTGINSVPVAKKDKKEAVLLSKFSDDNKVKAALVQSEFETDSGAVVYFYLGTDADSTYSKEGTTVYYNVFEKGAKTATDLELSYSTNSKTNTAIDNAAAAGFYTVNGKNNELDPIANGTKKDKVFYNADVTATAATDSNTLVDAEGNEYALYEANIVDLRGEDTTIKTAKKLAEAIEDGDVTKVAISYAENDSKTVADLYILP